MAIYHCTTKPISRSAGRSSTASSAYRSAQKILDKQTGEIHDYSRKQGVIYTEIIPPKNIDIKEVSREDLWNLAEQTEKRKDARVAREFVIALPHEISKEKQIEVAKEFSQYLSDRYGVVADLAIHEPSREGNDKNVHAHIMVTTRKITIDKELKAVLLTEKSTLELSNSKRKSLGLKATQEDIKEIREKWADMANNTLKKEGFKVRIDHRSYADQEKEQIPTKHEGVTVTELRRKGQIVGVAKLNEEIKEENRFIRSIKIEEQQNHKPSFLERIKIKKIEKIAEDLPPISAVVERVDQKIAEAEQAKLHASYEKIKIENEISSAKRAKERTEYEKKRGEKPTKQDPIEREYKKIVYRNSSHNITSFTEMLKMNRFIAEVKNGGNKTELFNALEKKHNSDEITKQPKRQNKPNLEPIAPALNDSIKKENNESKATKNSDQPPLQPEPLPNNDSPSTKEEFKRVLSEARRQAKTSDNSAKQSLKEIKNDSWGIDR